jgi:TM2 domain-containing membrane protein YozV
MLNCTNNQPQNNTRDKDRAMFCSKCGKAIDANVAFCPYCGASTAAVSGGSGGVNPNAAAAPVMAPAGAELKSKLAAGLLGIFLGHIGIHRFYLGYTTIGIVQIIVTIFTFGIGGLWGFIEGIMILAGGINKDARGLPLKD